MMVELVSFHSPGMTFSLPKAKDEAILWACPVLMVEVVSFMKSRAATGMLGRDKAASRPVGSKT